MILTTMRKPYSLKFLKYYLMIAVSSAAAFCLFYIYSYRILERETLERNRMILESIVDDFEQSFNAVLNDKWRLEYENRFVKVKNLPAPVDGPGMMRVLELQRRLRIYFNEIELLHSYYILFHESQLVLNGKIISGLSEFFNFFLDYPHLNAAESSQFFSRSQHTNGFIPTLQINGSGDSLLPSAEVITFFSMFRGGGEDGAAIIMLFQAEEIKQRFSDVDFSRGGYLVIEDDTGRPLFSMGDAPENRDFKEKLLTGIQGELTNWKYVIRQSPQIIFQKLYAVRNIFILLLLLGLAFSIWFASIRAGRDQKLYRKFLTASSSVPGSRKFKNIHSFIEAGFESMVRRNSRMESSLHSHTLFIQQEFMRNLLEGSPDYREYLKQCSFELPESRYRAVAVKLPPEVLVSDKQTTIRLRVRLIISDFTDYPVYEMRPNVFVFLFSSKAVSGTLRKIFERLNAEMENRVIIGVGSAADALDRVYQSAEEALLAVESRSDGSPICFYSEGSEDTYYFPEQLSTGLANCVTAGLESEVENLLNIVETKNLTERTLRRSVAELLKSEIIGLLLRLSRNLHGRGEDISIPGILHLCRCAEFSARTMQTIRDQFLAVTRLFGAAKQSHNDKLLFAVKQYLDEHYRDINLDLVTAADQFFVSVSYLSRFLKEQTGQTFHSIIEEKRINEAAKLLSSTNMPVKQVARQMGFASHNTFCRSFKRNRGLSPSEFRNIG